MRFAAAVLSLAGLVAAQSFSCPAGDNAGQATNTQMYLGSVDDVKSVVGNFQNAAWQGFQVTNTTGAENAINSTRSSSVSGRTVTETLVSVESNATYGQQVWTLSNPPLSFSSDFNVTGYQDSLTVQPLCSSGNSSQVTWNVTFCFSGASNLTGSVAGLLTQSHAAALLNVTEIIGKGNFTACPSSANSTETASAAASGKAMTTSSQATSSPAASPNSASNLIAGTSAALLAVAGVAVLL